MPGFRIMYNGALYSRRLALEEARDSVYELVMMARYSVPAPEKIIEHLEQKKLGLKADLHDLQHLLAEKGLTPEEEYLDLAYGRLPASFLQQNIDNIKGPNLSMIWFLTTASWIK